MDTNGTGRRYIAYARCAARDGSAAKLELQIQLIHRFGKQRAMRCVDEVRLSGVSGATSALRSDLRALLARKRDRDDFDVLIVEDLARLTRAGIAGISEITAEFEKCGVRILCLTEPWPPEDKEPTEGR